jgi:hypothetical protein
MLDTRDLVAALEDFVAAKIRERAPNAQTEDAIDMVRARLDLGEVLRALLRMEITP